MNIQESKRKCWWVTYLRSVEYSPALQVPGEAHGMDAHVDPQPSDLPELGLEQKVA